MNRRTGMNHAAREDILDIVAKVLLLRCGTHAAISWEELEAACEVECTIDPTGEGLRFHITNQH
jgi:hypothetical protein